MRERANKLVEKWKRCVHCGESGGRMLVMIKGSFGICDEVQTAGTTFNTNITNTKIEHTLTSNGLSWITHLHITNKSAGRCMEAGAVALSCT